MRGLEKDNMKRGHHTERLTSRHYERIGLRADSFEKFPIIVQETSDRGGGGLR